MCNVRPRLADVPVHFAHDANMLVAVQKRILLLALDTHVASACVGGLIRLEAGVGQDNNQPPCVPIVGGDWDVLLRNELRKLGRR